MVEGSPQLFVIFFLGLVSFGQLRVDVTITDKNQAANLQTSAEHHIVFPYVVDSDGNFVSHNIHHRTRRSLESPEVHYHVPFKNERFHLALRPNDGLMISGLEVEWRSGKRSKADRNCHFIGSVRNYTKSSVAISNCRGLAGLIRADHGREFFIEPVLGLDPSEYDGKHAHVIYRRSVGEGLRKNTTEPACGVTVEDVHDRDHFEEDQSDEGKGFHVKRRDRRSVSLMKNIEILLVADYSMTKYYSDRDLQTYLFTIMNMLSLVFKHRSIGSAINVVLVRMIIIDTEYEKGLNVTTHARKSLNSFCKWVKENNPPSDLDPQHADAAVLVTRQDICRNSYKSCNTLGLSNIDGMCNAGSECSYNQDTGFTLVYTIAHELGHNLGALHDDDYSSCRRLREHVMASNLIVNLAPQVWSKCTKKAIKSFFYKGWGWCLNDRPGIDLQPKLRRRMLPGERFDADAQCKMFFGANSTICSGSETGLCRTLWCVHKGNCATKYVYGKTSGFPALDGTPCGKTKYQWCYGGKCVERVALEEAIDGGWGGWSGWSECSQSCGRGVKRRTRKCNTPRPEHGGIYCIGEWKRHSICNVQACSKGHNPVQIQCKKFRALLVNGKKYDWSAKQNNRNPCELRCIPVLERGRSRIRKFIQAQDGTPCNHGTKNICIQGKCEHVGCDDRLYSSAKDDRCGVCRGDGRTCETKHDSFDQADGDGYTEALVIPAQSRNIVIQEVSGSPNFLALRSASGDYFLNGNWYIQWSGEYDVAGVSGQYSRRHNRETFKTKGPITEDLHVLLLYQGKNTGLKAQYDVKRNGTFKPRYFYWKYSLWTPCSVTCGRGIQKRDIECVDQENNVLDRTYCKNKKRYRKRVCRRKDCLPSWWVGVWHECSKTCGHAVKFRVVLCTVLDRKDIIDEERCEGEKPPSTAVCEQPLCWDVHPWFNCTSLCGPGFQHRLVQCPGNASQCDISTKPLSNRTCVGDTCSQWRIGAWGECSASCGNGTQIRNVSCENHEESMCRRDEKPMSSRACPSVPCPVWRVGEWSECSVTCGKGLETRNVTCEQGHVNFTCSASEKPDVVRSCLEKGCSGWTVGEWDSCSALCGEGVRHRKVVCTFKSCTAATRPKHKESCMIRECPKWSVSKWTECSVTCGEGVQYRNITCGDPIYPCSVDTKPPDIQPCLVSECSLWGFGNWSECSVSCGAGVQTRSIICNAATQEGCEKNIPEAERPCNEQPCLNWETGNWSECSRSCGPGIQERSVWCPSNSCNLEDKPNATRLCLNPDCAVWVTGNWGGCPVSCGEGVQTRQVYCSDDDESECDALEMPESTRDCFVSRCGTWIVTRWGSCSAKCGLGITTRNATCRYPDARNCSNKPKVVKACQEAACSKWSTGQWSPCSVTCNRGFQRRIVSCHGGRCLASTKPLSRKQCVMPSCGQWIPGNWSGCSSTCGDGVQIRDLRCSDADPEECEIDTKPIVKRFCNKQPCPYWSIGDWSSCSSSCGNGTQRRNISCVGGNGCPNTTKPAAYQLCFSGECPRWMVGDWISCSRSCGEGFQIRMVYCKGKTDTSCDGLVKPRYSQRCNIVPCPHWVAGHWSDCSKSCNGGVRTRNVSCNNSRVGECSNENKPSVTQDCGELPCPTWIVGQWTECSKSCNVGIRTRNVICNNNHVGECLEGSKPTSSLKCGQVPCPKWSVGQWSKCSKSCDGGLQIRNVTCENSHVGECLEENKPVTNQACAKLPCPEWSVSEWPLCSKSCNGGTQARTVTCKNNHIGRCLSTDKPDSLRSCSELPCPHWSVGEWSKCSKSCNGGIQTRTVTCNNSHVGECPEDDKPPTNQTCSNIPCPEWSVSEWSKCSKSCGGGLQTRTVSCENNHVGRCKPGTKPAAKLSCGDVPCPEWTVGEWSPCSKSCSSGLRYRSVACNNSHVGECLSKDKPLTNQSCGELPCPQWIVGSWGKCSKSCDGGLKVRMVTCRNSQVGECSPIDKPRGIKGCRKLSCPSWLVGEWSKCSKSCGNGGIQTRNVSCTNNHIGACEAKSKPVESQECGEVPCPEWSVGTWSKCSKSCDGGIQTRAVTCENGHIGKCPDSKRPSTNQKCGEVSCPKWFVGDWSTCSKSCDGGTQTRNVLCLNNYAGDCTREDKPASNQTCGTVPCPRWTVGSWGECSRSCGGGFQTRTVQCNNSHIGDCPRKGRPTANQTCGELPCPKWTVDRWSKCSKSCGGGVKYRSVTCRNNHVGECRKTEKPRDTKTCRKVSCPEWSVGEWSKCSKSCNGGTQKRAVFCKNNHVGECLAINMPDGAKKCADVPCPVWSAGQWSKCSKSCNGGTQTRKVTCENSHVGKCLLSIKPVSNRRCSEVPCPQWVVGQWSECSRSCNGGILLRNVTCQNSNVGDCLMKEKPTTSQNCGEAPCPKWSTGEWSKCSRSCNGGLQTRHIVCQNYQVGKCSDEDKPASKQNCNQLPCPRWSTGSWLKCSKSCGGGIKYRRVMCVNNQIGDCVAAEKPRYIKQCHRKPCPKWSAGEWSKCSKTCDGGIQTRPVTCENKHVGKCLTKDKPLTSQKCAKVPCPVWSASEWSKCSRTCDGGIQTRTVKCNNNHVGDCLPTDKPSDTRKCSDVPCPVWSAGNWSKCSKTCDGGIQTRTVKCNNSHVGDCLPTDKPSGTRKCSDVPCPVWSAGNWSKCSKICDVGIQTRTVKCNNSHVGDCLPTDKPSGTRKCNDVPCPNWSAGEWSKCSKTCNGGIQMRTVKCNNSQVGDCQATDRPGRFRKCNEVPCPKWSVGQWSPCSKSCDGGIQTRNVACENFHIGRCVVKKRPLGIKNCGQLPCPRWSVGQWSECSKSCNGGIQTRTVACANSQVGECVVTDKPDSTKTCSDVPCPEWSASEWSQCSRSCDGGIQTRNVTCKNSHIGDCLETGRPSTTKRCGEVSCPKWSVSEWSQCSRSCDGGTQTRNVTCLNGDVGPCILEKPAETQSCGHGLCPKWTVSQWSECSKSCDGGTQTRTVTCQNKNVGECEEANKPDNTKSCGDLPCPKWSVGEWSKCSKSCNGGTQTRTVTCLNRNVGECDEANKPDNTKSCSNLRCPKWSTGRWTECTKSCDGGIQRRAVFCQNRNVGECDESKKPDNTKSCGDLPCPKWSVGEWSKCSKSCDGGTQRRAMFCKNRNVGECDESKKPDNTKSCGDLPCPKWSVGEWSKCSKSCDGGTQRRAMFCKNRNVGECEEANKPDSIKSCGKLPCPKWSVSEWSKCSKSCGGGTQRRAMFCQNRNVGECDESKKPDNTKSCGDLPCPKWSVGEWSKCSKSCDGGTQRRAMFCKNRNVGECEEANKPDSIKSCGKLPCPKWSVSEWSKCSKSCGGGTQRRAMFCQNRNVGACDDTNKPDSIKSCGKQPCPKWAVGEWSKCTKSCDGGTQRRPVFCQNRNVGACDDTNKPDGTQSCGQLPCPKWAVGEWSKCSKSCDGGFQTRIIQCENHQIGDCLVTDKPIDTKKCTKVPCPKWSVGEWSKCSKSCDGGIKTRRVTCQNSYVGACSATDKPNETKRCKKVPCPQWIVGVWSRCSKSCDGGTQTRMVTCKNDHVGKCPEKGKPDTHQICSDVPCPEWSVGVWSKCSKSCDGGTQTRAVTCENNSIGHCIDSNKPPISQTCGKISCPKWIVDNWSQCSKSCGSGERTRTVQCSGGVTLPCESTKPAGREVCNDFACPVWIVGDWTKCKARRCPKGKRSRLVFCSWKNRRDCNRNTRPVSRQRCVAECPEWKTGEWSECRGSCTKGTMSRRVWCEGGDRTCKLNKKPVDHKPCQRSSCLVWETGAWNECPVSCGGGLRSRNVRCINQETGGVIQGCERSAKPMKFQACALNECPPSPDDVKPTPRTECRQAVKHTYFCNLLLRPSLSELCLYKQWKRKCCKNCFRINAQRRIKK